MGGSVWLGWGVRKSSYCRAELNKQSLGLIPEMQRPKSQGENWTLFVQFLEGLGVVPCILQKQLF